MSSSPSIKPTPVPSMSRATPLATPAPSRLPSVVYGDSTGFPHGGNFIETIRHAVDCGTALLTAQHVIQRSIARAADVDRARQTEKARLESMGASIKRTLAGEMAMNAERVLRTGARILDASRVAIDGEVASLETVACTELARARRTAEDARAAGKRAVETFLMLHDLPGTETALRLIAEEESYRGEASISTPFGVDASFALQIPEAHEWGRPRRVADLSPGIEVHVPLESGLFFKKVAVQPVKLDRLFVSAVHVGPVRSAITLRKQPCAGPGYKLTFDSSGDRTRVLLARLGEDGLETVDPVIDLAGDDATHVLRLWQRTLDSTRDLAQRRQAMTRASYDGHPVGDLDEPRLVADRLVKCLAPIVREIARRSGAPGELVLRRDVRAGRREEIYITKAELHEKVLALPPLHRATFDPFELADSPRSPRAPAPSVPAYSEVSEDDVVSSESVVTQVAAVALS